MKRIKFWMALITLVYATSAYGQGWIRMYGANEEWDNNPGASSTKFPVVLSTQDSGYMVLCKSHVSDSLVFFKVNGAGDILWIKNHTWHDGLIASEYMVHGVDGGFVFAGRTPSQHETIRLEKRDEGGQSEWIKFLDVLPNQAEIPKKLITTADGGYAIIGLGNYLGNYDTTFLFKTNAVGEIEATKTYISDPSYDGLIFFDITEIPAEGFLITGREINYQTQDGNGFIMRTTLDGTIVWRKLLGQYRTPITVLLRNDSSCIVFDSENLMTKLNLQGSVLWEKTISYENFWQHRVENAINGNQNSIIISGILWDSQSAHNAFIYKLDSLGNKIWERRYEDIHHRRELNNLCQDDNGFIVSVGNMVEISPVYTPELLLIKIDSNGNLYTSAITGTVHRDSESDCLPDPTETGLSGWLVQADGTQSFATLTDAFGNFVLPLDTGSYDVAITPPGPYWETCNSTSQVNVTEFYDTLSLDFPAQAIDDCPYLTLDISTPFLRRCFDNNYYVHYCNDGTNTANDVAVEVTLDPYLTYVSATLPLVSQNGNVLTFNLGDVAVGDCGSFQITTYLDCDSTVLGQTHCTSAHITPDSLCLPPDPLWDGSSIEVDANCNGDSVIFTITNVGSEGMPAPLGYIIIEDQIVLLTNDFQLGAGESITVAVPANGGTFHLEAQQALAHPSGFATTGATVEGCGGWISLGFFTQWAFDDDPDPFTDVDCQANVGSFDPNDKQGFPTGLGEEHLLEPGQDIEYLIRFQNTGTDTAFKVTVVDVLPPELDLATVRPGASSHPYTYGVTPEGWLTFTFENIQLPDSTTNEAASHGFIRFRASQRPGLGWGNVIANTALIYFDFNAPVQTNTFKHRIGQVFPWSVVGTTPPVFQPKTNVRVVPNPLTDSALLQVEGIEPGPLNLVLTDISGKILRQQTITGTGFEFHRGELNPGLYFFKIERNGERVGSGKLMVR